MTNIKYLQISLQFISLYGKNVFRNMKTFPYNVNRVDYFVFFYQPRTDQYFNEMRKIANNQSQKKVSSRIRFALQDTIELREVSYWCSRLAMLQ